MQLSFNRVATAVALLVGTALSGCAVVPIPIPVSSGNDSNFCPPGQAKKGLCAPDQGGGFCPPGQAKKGAC